MEPDAGVRDGRRVRSRLLPLLCALTTVLVCAAILDNVWGPGGRPLFGYWDSVVVSTSEPFVAEFTQSTPGGATARAGIRDGDRVDLRGLDAYGRVAIVFQPCTAHALDFVVARGRERVPIHFVGSTQYENGAALKIAQSAMWELAYLFAIGCAWLIALRRGASREGWYLCLTLLAVAAQAFSPDDAALPNGTAGALAFLAWGAATCAAALLPVALARRFGARSRARVVMESATVVVAAVTFGGYAAGTIGLLGATLDPLPFVYAVVWRVADVALYAFSLGAVVLAVASTERAGRARAAWLLLPLPATLMLAAAALQLEPVTTTWEANMALSALGNAFFLVGAVAVTFALLKRRVVDVRFVIGRTLVVAGVSAIVVAAFALLEWLLGTVLANASHATGLAANAALALVLGVSMSYIHKRVDAFVDFVFFHRRHENERALRDFAKEAAFVTRRDALLDHAIEKVRAHTDARAAVVLLDGDGRYRAARAFGDAPSEIDENDAAILALKAKHAAIDPHRYTTALAADVALPMLVRGRLVGVLACGARASGESYAPDELAALGEFAHGVGAALDALDASVRGAVRDDAILAELRALRAELAARGRAAATDSPPAVPSS